MEIKVGVDLTPVSKIKKIIESNPDFVQEVFTDRERAYCQGKKRCYEHYAVRFAAKEAFLKAIATGMGAGIDWGDIEVQNDFKTGKPYLALAGKAADIVKKMKAVSIDLSLSHTEDLGIAYVAILLE